MKKIFLNILSLAVIAAIFYFLGRELQENWAAIRAYEFHFNLTILGVASLAYALSFIIFAGGWYLILRYLHHPIPFFAATIYLCITQTAKYIPGKIWVAVTRMKFLKPHGVPNSITLLSTGTEAVIEIFAATYVSIIAILQTDVLGGFSLVATAAITLLGFVLLVPSVFYYFINVYLKITKQAPIAHMARASFWKLVLLQIVYVGGNIVLGGSQVLFLQSFTSVARADIPVLISIGVLSYVAGILAVFAPGGLGVREGIWYLALKNITLHSVALIYSFVSRLWMIVVELVLLLISVLLLRMRLWRNYFS